MVTRLETDWRQIGLYRPVDYVPPQQGFSLFCALLSTRQAPGRGTSALAARHARLGMRAVTPRLLSLHGARK